MTGIFFFSGRTTELLGYDFFQQDGSLGSKEEKINTISILFDFCKNDYFGQEHQVLG